MHRVIQALLSSLTLLMVIVCAGIYTNIYAQSGATTASIAGVISDEQGAVVGGITIAVRNLDTNLQREALTGENGGYNVKELPPGRYELKASGEGFKSSTSRFELGLGTVLKLDIALKLGTVGEVVEVVASNALEEGKTESSTNQDRGRIQNLPINVRDFLDFALTSPRVTSDRLPKQGTTATSGLSFNGQSARLNNITLDGSSNNESYTNGVRSSVSQEAVQEFQVVSDTYSAEFGRALGGVVNIVTKSGTNDFRGTLFGLLRNESLSARDAFATFKPEFRQYQFGATLAGPLKKDKSFFFTSFERLTISENLIVTIPNDVVAAARRNGYTNVQNGPVPISVGTTNLLARVDTQINAKDQLTFRYNGGFKYNGKFESISAFPGGLSDLSSGGTQRLDDNSFNVINIYAGSAFVNETRFLYSHRSQDVETGDPSNALTQLNSPLGTISFGQNFTVPQVRELDIFQIVNNVSFVRGNQSFKFGVDFNYVKAPAPERNDISSFPLVSGGFGLFVPIDFGAALGMPGLPVLSALQAFDPASRTPDQVGFLTALGPILAQQIPGFPVLPFQFLQLPVVQAQSFGFPKVEASQKLFSTFAQDDIKLKPNLLIKLGVRYDIFRASFVPNNNGNFSPRIGISYSPKALSNLTLRGSYGMYFTGAPSIQTALISKIYNSDNPLTQFAFNVFPFSVIPFNLPGHRFPVGATPPAPPNGLPVFPQFLQTFLYDKNFRAGYSHQATLGFNYLVDKDTLLSVDYNLVRGLKLPSARFINPVVRPVPGSLFLSGLTGRVRPDRGFLFEFESAFDSYYHGLSITLNRRLSKRFTALISYTYSKALDNTNDFRTDQENGDNPLAPGLERGFSLQDTRSRFVASGTVDFGFIKGPVFQDLRVAVITELTSGRPYNLQAGQDVNGNFETIPQDRVREGGVAIARNRGITPGFASVDLRVSRAVQFNERFRLEGIIEFFNLFNRTNISGFNNVYPPNPDGSFNLPPRDGGRFVLTPDRFTNAFSPRQIQLGFRFLF